MTGEIGEQLASARHKLVPTDSFVYYYKYTIVEDWSRVDLDSETIPPQQPLTGAFRVAWVALLIIWSRSSPYAQELCSHLGLVKEMMLTSYALSVLPFCIGL
jgi:hypothetical protein